MVSAYSFVAKINFNILATFPLQLRMILNNVVQSIHTERKKNHTSECKADVNNIRPQSHTYIYMHKTNRRMDGQAETLYI